MNDIKQELLLMWKHVKPFILGTIFMIIVFSYITNIFGGIAVFLLALGSFGAGAKMEEVINKEKDKEDD